MNYVIHNKQNLHTGWLGNKMFQLASTMGIAHKNGMKPLFPYHEYHSYFKGHYMPCCGVADIETIEYKEKGIHYEDVVFNTTKSYDLKGYYQSFRYFDNIKDTVREMFQFKNSIQLCIEKKYSDILDLCNQNSELVMVHIRRGDYLKLKQHHTCLGETDYYVDAIDHIKNKVANPVFVIFSDDIPWCKEYFNGNNMIFAQGNNEVQDMHFMTLCQHAIIANSSFSWWGAWLQKHIGKIIIAPKQWFGPEYTKLGWDTRDMIPESWVQI